MEPRWGSAEPHPVEVGFTGPAAQSRVTVAFRLFLMVPHFFVLFAFGIASYVLVIVGWFAALILGRLPAGLAEFISGVVRYTTRLYGYGYLLTDQYPPFGLEAGGYPIDVATYPGRLNRLAVLFRFVLMVPAYVVVALVGSGLSVAMFFIWLIVLVAGRMPASLYQAVASVLRYQTRFYAYFSLVSSAYPGGLFGDAAPVPASWPTAVPSTPATYGPGPEVSETETRPVVSTWETTMPAVAQAPLATRLPLTTGARWITALFLVLGLLGFAPSAIVFVVSGSRLGGAEAGVALSVDYGQLAGAVQDFQSAASACGHDGDLSCPEHAAANLAPKFATFRHQVAQLKVPSADRADAARLADDAGRMASLLTQMASAASPSEYLATAGQFQEAGTAFDQDYRTLSQELI